MPVVHCKRAKYDVYIGRPSQWGNPYTHLGSHTLAQYVVATREESIARYRTDLWTKIQNNTIDLQALAALDGKILGCWCHPFPCHGSVLLNAAEWAAVQLETARA